MFVDGLAETSQAFAILETVAWLPALTPEATARAQPRVT